MNSGLQFSILVGIVAIAAAQAFAQEKYADPEITPKDREHWAFRPPTRP